MSVATVDALMVAFALPRLLIEIIPCFVQVFIPTYIPQLAFQGSSSHTVFCFSALTTNWFMAGHRVQDFKLHCSSWEHADYDDLWGC